MVNRITAWLNDRTECENGGMLENEQDTSHQMNFNRNSMGVALSSEDGLLPSPIMPILLHTDVVAVFTNFGHVTRISVGWQRCSIPRRCFGHGHLVQRISVEAARFIATNPLEERKGLDFNQPSTRLTGQLAEAHLKLVCEYVVQIGSWRVRNVQVRHRAIV